VRFVVQYNAIQYNIRLIAKLRYATTEESRKIICFAVSLLQSYTELKVADANLNSTQIR